VRLFNNGILNVGDGTVTGGSYLTLSTGSLTVGSIDPASTPTGDPNSPLN
jgi:hypothetical protein